MKTFRRKQSKQLTKIAEICLLEIKPITYKFQGLAKFIGYSLYKGNNEIIGLEPVNYSNGDKWMLCNNRDFLNKNYYKNVTQICKELFECYILTENIEFSRNFDIIVNENKFNSLPENTKFYYRKIKSLI